MSDFVILDRSSLMDAKQLIEQSVDFYKKTLKELELIKDVFDLINSKSLGRNFEKFNESANGLVVINKYVDIFKEVKYSFCIKGMGSDVNVYNANSKINFYENVCSILIFRANACQYFLDNFSEIERSFELFQQSKEILKKLNMINNLDFDLEIRMVNDNLVKYPRFDFDFLCTISEQNLN
jgi:hypothetical protein